MTRVPMRTTTTAPTTLVTTMAAATTTCPTRQSSSPGTPLRPGWVNSGLTLRRSAIQGIPAK